MSEDFTNILTQISSGPTNKQVQELGTILGITLEIVINAVDMLEANFNNINSSLNARMDSIESRLQSLGAGPATISQPPIIKQQIPAPGQMDEDTPMAPLTTPVPEFTSAPPVTGPPGQVQAVPSVPGQPQQPEQPPRPISPINIRRALNSEIKQLFAKMRTQTE